MTLFGDLVGMLADGIEEGNPEALSADAYAPEAPAHWEPWLRELLPDFFSLPFAFFHREFWEWGWSIQKDVRPRPFIAVWPRDAGKSTSVEALCLMLGARRVRQYVLYVCETQDQADDHVKTISNMMTLPQIAKHYPSFADRAVNKFGHAQSWRRERVIAANGFVIEGLGLDKARRGAKLDYTRPDLIVLDDVDGESDTIKTVGKKIRAITRKIVPAGSSSSGVVGVQNLVHGDSIFSQLVEGRVDFLMDRIVSGPHPLVEDMRIEQRSGRWEIIEGRPTWPAMTIEKCEDKINTIGPSAFRVEMQHETTEVEGLVFRRFKNSLDGNLAPAWDADEGGALEREIMGLDEALERMPEGPEREATQERLDELLAQAPERVRFNPELEFELGIDDGFVDARAVLFIQRQPRCVLVFDEIYHSGALEEETILLILEKCAQWHCRFGGKEIKDVWPKKAREMRLGQIAQELRGKGVRLPSLAAVSHEAVQLRKRLQSADIPARNWMVTKVTKGSTRVESIKVTRKAILTEKGVRILKVMQGQCPNLIKEITKLYRYPDGRRSANEMPQDGNDHACEALENWFWLRMRRILQKGDE